MKTIEFPKSTEKNLVKIFVRSRTDDPEMTSKTDLFCFGALALSGSKTESLAGERAVRTVLKYQKMPKKSATRVVNTFRLWSKYQVATFLKKLRPHTEIGRMLDSYTTE